ncbi:MAG: PQQ-binding-like beta-propeller repeat protein [Chloroflexota bacterium]
MAMTYKPYKKTLLLLILVMVMALMISFPAQHSEVQAAGPVTANTADWPSWGYDLSNHRYNANETAITPATVGKLKVRWTFAFPDTMINSNQPTVIGDTVYVGSWNGNVYAIDMATGQQRWRFFTGITGKTGITRSAIVVAKDLVLFGDQLGRFFAVNKGNGTLAWIQQDFEKHPLAQITGSPVVYGDHVYVPMASREESAGKDPTYLCCTFRGSLTALNISDGSVAWRFYTVDEPQPSTQKNVPLGPGGVGLWSTPAIDPDAGLIYLTTGNSYSPPVSPNSDAILAINLEDGKLRWSTQLTPADWFNEGCQQTPPVNCESEPGGDFDFSSSPLLISSTEMTSKLVIGIQKNGTMSALNALTGKVIWQQMVGEPTAINWGATYDGYRIYTGDASFNRHGGVYALNPATGKIVWQSAMPSCIPGADQAKADCWSGNMNAAVSTPGLIWISAMDGQLHAFDSETGKALWSYDTAHSVQSTNGVAGHGGSIAADNATIASGQVYVMSGYAKWNEHFLEGNVLYAFWLPQPEEF